MTSLRPPGPILVADRFAPLGRFLVDLLAGLEPDAWQRPTVCAGWTVHDVAAHLLDGACRRLSFGRDGLAPPEPPAPLREPADVVAFLDGLNATWVDACRRLSPRLVTELTAAVEPMLAAHVDALDPFSDALFPVSWAGDSASPCWFDIARELTERWHHQQQIRMAAGAPLLDDDVFVEPVLETLVRVLPHHYRGLGAAPGTAVALTLDDRPSGWTLRREGERWALFLGADPVAAATVSMSTETAWRILTRGIAPGEARRRARVHGDPTLAQPLFTAVAVMAAPRKEDDV